MAGSTASSLIVVELLAFSLAHMQKKPRIAGLFSLNSYLFIFTLLYIRIGIQQVLQLIHIGGHQFEKPTIIIRI